VERGPTRGWTFWLLAGLACSLFIFAPLAHAEPVPEYPGPSEEFYSVPPPGTEWATECTGGAPSGEEPESEIAKQVYGVWRMQFFTCQALMFSQEQLRNVALEQLLEENRVAEHTKGASPNLSAIESSLVEINKKLEGTISANIVGPNPLPVEGGTGGGEGGSKATVEAINTSTAINEQAAEGTREALWLMIGLASVAFVAFPLFRMLWEWRG